jgi:hypothetical protein
MLDVLSIRELLDFMSEACSVIQSAIHGAQNGEMFLEPLLNPEVIVGETGPDGVVESETRRKKRIKVSVKHMHHSLFLFQVIIKTMKDGLLDSPEMFLQRVEKSVLAFLGTEVSALKDRILEEFADEQLEAAQKVDRKIVSPKMGKKRPKRSDTSSPRDRNTMALATVRSLVRRYGMSIIPRELRKVPNENRGSAEDKQPSRSTSTTKPKNSRSNRSKRRKS